MQVVTARSDIGEMQYVPYGGLIYIAVTFIVVGLAYRVVFDIEGDSCAFYQVLKLYR